MPTHMQGNILFLSISITNSLIQYIDQEGRGRRCKEPFLRSREGKTSNLFQRANIKEYAQEDNLLINYLSVLPEAASGGSSVPSH